MTPQVKMEVFAFTKRHANDLSIGNAILELFDAADPDNDQPQVSIANAAMFLFGGTPEAPVPAQAAPEKPKLWTDHPNVKAGKPKPTKRGGNMGARRCDSCGESKGITAFASGSETCRKCAGTSTGRPPKTTKTKSYTLVPKDKPTTNGKRLCMSCDTPKALSKFDGAARVCRVCETQGVDSGEIES